jgi:transcriptional regulator with XRE-family HTH domain
VPVVSQRALSLTLGLSERQVRRIEQGHAVPDAKLLWRIAKALAVTITELYLNRRDGRA